jgi:hypothetical protein
MNIGTHNPFALLSLTLPPQQLAKAVPGWRQKERLMNSACREEGGTKARVYRVISSDSGE